MNGFGEGFHPFDIGLRRAYRLICSYDAQKGVGTCGCDFESGYCYPGVRLTTDAFRRCDFRLSQTEIEWLPRNEHASATAPRAFREGRVGKHRPRYWRQAGLWEELSEDVIPRTACLLPVNLYAGKIRITSDFDACSSSRGLRPCRSNRRIVL